MKWNALAVFAASLGLSFGVTIGVMRGVQQARDDKANREKRESENRKYNIESDKARNDFCKKYGSSCMTVGIRSRHNLI